MTAKKKKTSEGADTRQETSLFQGRATIRGKVTSAETGRGLARAKVRVTIGCYRQPRKADWASSEFLGRTQAETSADKNGFYSVDVETLKERPADKTITIHFFANAEAPRHVPGPDRYRAPEPPVAGERRTFNIKLQPAYGVKGRVVDEAGKPIEGVKVIVYQSSSHGCFNPGLVGDDWPVTGADGRFLADGMPLGLPSEQRQTAGFFHKDYVRRFIQRLAGLPRNRRNMGDLGDVVLRPGLSLSGRVKDKKGRPVSGAKVRVIAEAPYQGDPGCARPPAKYEIETDKKGRYLAKGLTPMVYNVYVMHDAHPPGSATGVGLMTRSRRGVDVILSGAGILSGKVTRSTGSPAANFKLAAEQYTLGIEKSTRTDKLGRYRLGGFAPGAAVFFEGFSDMDSLAVFKPPQNRADIRVPAKVRVRGRLVDRETGRPVKAQRQVVLTTSPAFGRGSQSQFDSKDGRFELKDARAGDYYLCACAEGYASTCRKMHITKRSANLGDIPMHRGITLRGRITGSDGAPIPNAEAFIDSPEFYDGKTVRANKSGVYKFTKLADGVYKLRVRADGWAAAFFNEVVLPVDAETITHDVTMAKGVKVSGRVTDGNKPVDRQIVVLSRPKPKQGWERRPWIDDTNTDLSGKFVLPHVAPGEYALRCGLEERRIAVGERGDLRRDFAWPGNYERDESSP